MTVLRGFSCNCGAKLIRSYDSSVMWYRGTRKVLFLKIFLFFSSFINITLVKIFEQVEWNLWHLMLVNATFKSNSAKISEQSVDVLLIKVSWCCIFLVIFCKVGYNLEVNIFCAWHKFRTINSVYRLFIISGTIVFVFRIEKK